MTPEQIVDAVGRERLVVIVRTPDPATSAGIVRAAAAGGARVIEVTADTPGVAGVIKELRAELPAEVVIGAGTVTRPEQVDEVVAAGARFIVSPWLVPDVVRRAGDLGAPPMPGAMTPAEIAAAVAAGAPVVKLFPAEALSPGFLKAVAQVMPELRAVPTGGVDAGNAAEWLAAGAFAVGVGGAFTKAWKRGGAEAVEALTAELKEAVA
jgi:2-dehydro-3-deoxyphosphogluconate aldolase/(4S)-4-hydroxy-2-oxoglutarate aldolase